MLGQHARSLVFLHHCPKRALPAAYDPFWDIAQIGQLGTGLGKEVSVRQVFRWMPKLCIRCMSKRLQMMISKRQAWGLEMSRRQPKWLPKLVTNEEIRGGLGLFNSRCKMRNTWDSGCPHFRGAPTTLSVAWAPASVGSRSCCSGAILTCPCFRDSKRECPARCSRSI